MQSKDRYIIAIDPGIKVAGACVMSPDQKVYTETVNVKDIKNTIKYLKAHARKAKKRKIILVCEDYAYVQNSRSMTGLAEFRGHLQVLAEIYKMELHLVNIQTWRKQFAFIKTQKKDSILDKFFYCQAVHTHTGMFTETDHEADAYMIMQTFLTKQERS